MAKFVQDNFNGGIAEGSKRGYKGAFQDALGIDFRSDPDRLRILPRMVKISSTTVTGLPKWGIEYGNSKFVYDDDGKIYEIDAVEAVTSLHTVPSSNGQGMEIFNDELWYANANKIGKATDPAGTPVFTDDYFTTPQYETPDFFQTGTGQTYTAASAIAEAATDRLLFTPTADNVVGLSLTVVAKGTGTWTVELHSSADAVLGRISIATGSLPGSEGVIRLLFTNTIPVTAGQTYHFHVISSDGAGTVRTGTTNDFRTAQTAVYQYLANIEMDQHTDPTTTAVTNGTIVSLANTYSVLVAPISEAAVDRLTFVPEFTAISAIAVLIRERGTSSDWTLTLHDSLNRTVGTATLANASVKQRGTWQQFRFSTPVEVIPGGSYHFHLTVSDASGTPTVATSTASNMSTAYYRTYAPILDDDTDYHPMKTFLNLLLVGNGNHLLTIDDAEVVEIEALTFPKGEVVRCIETIGDYVAIATWRGGAISAFGKSRVYMWDGTSPTFNAFLDFDGQVNAMYNDSNKLVVIHGTQCTISYYTGGITKMRKLKNMSTNLTAEVMPGAMAIYEGLLHFGLSNASSNAVTSCVYSYGRKDKDYPYSLNKDYPISTGDVDSTVQIGMLMAIGVGKFYVGWKRGSVAGIDKIDLTKEQQYAEVTLMRFDDNNPNQEKEITSASLRFTPLLWDTIPNPDTYQKITLQYRYDNKSSWVEAGTVDPLNQSLDRSILYKSFPQPEDTRWFEIEWRMIFESNGDTNVENVIFTMFFNRLDEEQIGIKE
jgi:hypothetical protein